VDGVPAEQTGSYWNLPPAVILDVDETVPQSDYQAWNVTAGTSFDPET
jgi:acid phosphatase